MSYYAGLESKNHQSPIFENTYIQMNESREQIKNTYGSLLFFAISNVLFQADPIGINFRSNTDEYDPETRTIISRLKTANTAQDVQAIVHEEFDNWFGADTAGSQQQYEAVSLKIWELWNEFQQKQN